MKIIGFLICCISIGGCLNRNNGKNIVPHKNNDTLFLKREIGDTVYPYYHVIYIENSRNGEYHQILTNFSFTQYENLNDFNKEINKRGICLLKHNTLNLPTEWLPLNLYKGKYYLYAPSDWGNLGRKILNDSTLIFWFMDGPYPYSLQSIKSNGNNSYSIRTKDLFYKGEGYVIPEILNIYMIDPKNKIAVWEFKSIKEKEFQYGLYVAKESIPNFDIIINYCRTDKQNEFEFDPIDYPAILKKAHVN